EGRLSPAAAAMFEQEFKAAMTEAVKERAEDATSLKARIKRLEQETDRLIDAITAVGASDALATRLRATEREYSGAEGRTGGAGGDGDHTRYQDELPAAATVQ